MLNAQFTAGLLSPFENTLGQGLGLSSINLTLGYYGNVGFTASRLLGKAVSAVYAVTFGIPQTQSFGLRSQPNPETSTTLNFFCAKRPDEALATPNSPGGYGAGYLAREPLIGNSGFSLTDQRLFLVNDPSIKRSFRLCDTQGPRERGAEQGVPGREAMSSAARRC